MKVCYYFLGGAARVPSSRWQRRESGRVFLTKMRCPSWHALDPKRGDMKYKAILFDLDGTLLDSVPTIVKATRETLASMGIDVADVTLRHAIGIPLKVQAHRFAPGREEQFIDDYRTTYLQYLGEDSKLFPGTLEMLASLRGQGYKTAIVTSKNVRGTTKAIELTGMAALFDCVITADDVTHYKPDPEPIQKGMALLGVTPEESVYVGDSAFDIDMAQRAGVLMVGVSWGARTREELLMICPDGVVDNWEQFLALLESQG